MSASIDERAIFLQYRYHSRDNMKYAAKCWTISLIFTRVEASFGTGVSEKYARASV